MQRKPSRQILQTIACLLAGLAMLAAVTRPNTAAPAPAPLDVERIDAFVSAQIERHGLPGLALAVVDGDRVALLKGYGTADPSGRPVTPQTPFLLASVSKPLTASAVMQLVETGQVELDAPLRRYAPEFQMADPQAADQITVRHLLLHTSGLPVTACDTRKDAVTLAEYVAELHTVALDAPPGTHYSYCSGNYNLLGRLIETVSGQSFGEYMQQHVFTPLDMRHSFTSEVDAQQDGLAQGYQWVFGLLVPVHYRYNPSQLPSGYMISSAEDMSHFLIAQMNEGRYAGNSLLSASSIAAMQEPGIKRGESGEYGFGWFIAPFGDVEAVWHDGVNETYHTLLLMEPETRRGAVLLFNAFGIVAYENAYQELETGIARMLAGQAPLPETGKSLSTAYLIIDTVLVVLLGLALIPLLNMRRWQGWLLARQQAGRLPRTRVLLRAAWEIGFALIFLLVVRLVIIPGLGAQSWFEIFKGFPDFVLWLWAFALIGLVTGVARLAVILRTRQAGPARGEPRDPGHPAPV